MGAARAKAPTKVPHSRWKTMTFLAALRHDRIDAPWFIEGPIDGASFRAYVEEVLLPTLRPGDVVVMDNLGSHKGKACASSFDPPALSYSSCQNTHPT
jgi:DDE superfamily endonuclease